MVLLGSWWFLSVCLLSWFSYTWELRSVIPDSELLALPLVVWSEVEDIINMDTIKTFVEHIVPGSYVLPMEIGKNMTKIVEGKIVDVTSEVCQILAKDPKLQQGYISITFSNKLQMLKKLVEKCQIPTLKDVVSVPGRKFQRLMMRLSRLIKQQ